MCLPGWSSTATAACDASQDSIERPTAGATSSSAASTGSKASAASPPDTTRPPLPTKRRSYSPRSCSGQDPAGTLPSATWARGGRRPGADHRGRAPVAARAPRGGVRAVRRRRLADRTGLQERCSKGQHTALSGKRRCSRCGGISGPGPRGRSWRRPGRGARVAVRRLLLPDVPTAVVRTEVVPRASARCVASRAAQWMPCPTDGPVGRLPVVFTPGHRTSPGPAAHSVSRDVNHVPVSDPTPTGLLTGSSRPRARAVHTRDQGDPHIVQPFPLPPRQLPQQRHQEGGRAAGASRNCPPASSSS